MTVASVRVAAAGGAGGGGGGNLMFVSDGGDGPKAGVSEDGHPLAYPTQFYLPPHPRRAPRRSPLDPATSAWGSISS